MNIEFITRPDIIITDLMIINVIMKLKDADFNINDVVEPNTRLLEVPKHL